MSQYLIPSQTLDFEGEHATVTVALLAVAQCVHGHNTAHVIPDTADARYAESKVAQWASGHAKTCTGPGPIQQPDCGDRNQPVAA